MFIAKEPCKLFATDLDETKWSRICTRKTRPCIADEQTKLYKIHQKSIITFNKDEVLTLYNKYGEDNRWGHKHHIDIVDILEYIREQLNNSSIFYDGNFYYQQNIHFNEDPDKLPDDFTTTVKVIIVQEDSERITKKTNKEKILIEEANNRKNKEKIFNAFIKPMLSSLFNKYGLQIYNGGIYFNSNEACHDFVLKALEELVIKEMEKSGITTKLTKTVKTCDLHKPINSYNTLFYTCDFEIIENKDNKTVLQN